MLASYTRAINKQENRTGSLFRQETKSICLNEIKRELKDWVVSNGITYFTVDTPESQYAQICFNYIHNNPVNAYLTSAPEEWEFSSYLDIAGIRDGELINRGRIQELGLKL